MCIKISYKLGFSIRISICVGHSSQTRSLSSGGFIRSHQRAVYPGINTGHPASTAGSNTSVHFSNLPWASDSEKWPNRRPVHRSWLAAGTLQFIGHNRGVPDSVAGRTKRPRMLATRNGFPRSLSIMLIASWN